MKKKLFATLAAAALLASVTPAAFAISEEAFGGNGNGVTEAPAPVTPPVTFVAVDASTGKPVQGVVFDFMSAGKVSEGTTDANGVATAESNGGAAVSYRVNVEELGYEADSYVGEAKPGQSVTFTLRPKTVSNDANGHVPAPTVIDGTKQQEENNKGQEKPEEKEDKAKTQDAVKKASEGSKKAETGKKALPKTSAVK